MGGTQTWIVGKNIEHVGITRDGGRRHGDLRNLSWFYIGRKLKSNTNLIKLMFFGESTIQANKSRSNLHSDDLVINLDEQVP